MSAHVAAGRSATGRTVRSGVIALAVALAGPVTAQQPAQQPPAQGQQQQGPRPMSVHDPVMIRADGTYYLFATGRGVAVWTSPDLKTWTAQPPVFDTIPAWVPAAVPGFRGNSFWAPDIAFHNGKYHLYYAASSFGSNQSAIGHATNVTLDRTNPHFKWVDEGMVVRSVPGRDMWNAIDPNLAFDDEGTPWLSFGSFWSGMKLFKLAPDLTSPAQPQEWYTVAARPRYAKLDERAAGDPMNGAIEAPFIFKKDGWYYLFVSWDACCRGAQSTYKVVVGRSRSIKGPYLDAAGVNMLHGGGTLVVRGDGTTWAAVGHNSAYTWDNKDYLVFHAYPTSTTERGSRLLVKQIEWDREGWPHVRLD